MTACAVPKPADTTLSGVDAGVPWQRVEVRHLIALAAVAREASFRRAADRLGYVQSAISAQIAYLERAAGARLLERSSGTSTVELTDAGRILVNHTEQIVGRLDAAHAELSSLATQRVGSVSVAGLERLSANQLARLVRLFRQRQPRAELTLHDAVADQLGVELLRSGALDLVVGDLPLPECRFGHVVLCQDRYALLVGTGSRLAGRAEPPTLEEIRFLRLMVPAEPHTSDRLDARLRELGIEGRSSLKPPSAAIAQALVGAGLGEAVVPWRLLDHADPRTVAIDLSDLVPERTLVVAWDRDREHPSVVHDFIKAARVAGSAERAITYGPARTRDESAPGWRARSVA